MNGEYKKTAKHSPLMASENRPSSQLVVNYVFSARTMLNEDWNAEDTVRGFGWTQEKNGKTYIKWERLNGYCEELGFPSEVGKDDYIPESLF